VSGSHQLPWIKKGHPRIEVFIGPGIFVSPDSIVFFYLRRSRDDVSLHGYRVGLSGDGVARLRMKAKRGPLPFPHGYGGGYRRRVAEKQKTLTTHVTVIDSEAIEQSRAGSG
jgi:hypothetical protein